MIQVELLGINNTMDRIDSKLDSIEKKDSERKSIRKVLVTMKKMDCLKESGIQPTRAWNVWGKVRM